MTLMTAHSLVAGFGPVEVLRDLDFDVAAGELVGLVGPNGAGKTTLLRVMAGLLTPTQGDVAFDGVPAGQIDRAEFARQVAYLPQGGEVHWAVTVGALVMMGRLPHLGRWRRPTAVDERAVAEALAACDLEDLENRPIFSLSGGERARALLARALAVEPRLLLADEPVAGLDPAHQLDVMAKLRDLAAGGAGVVVVMHDLTHAARYCDRLALLHDKSIVAAGDPADVLSTERLATCFGIRAHRGVIGDESFILPLERAGND